MQTFAVPMQMRLCQVYKRRCGENGQVSSKKACCIGRHMQQDCLSQLKKTVTLLKSTFKLEAISAIYYLSAMEGKMFDVRLISEFSGAATDMPIVEWVKNVELVGELCTMKKVERVLPLRLRGGALAICRQLSAGQKADAEQIK